MRLSFCGLSSGCRPQRARVLPPVIRDTWREVGGRDPGGEAGAPGNFGSIDRGGLIDLSDGISGKTSQMPPVFGDSIGLVQDYFQAQVRSSRERDWTRRDRTVQDKLGTERRLEGRTARGRTGIAGCDHERGTAPDGRGDLGISSVTNPALLCGGSDQINEELLCPRQDCGQERGRVQSLGQREEHLAPHSRARWRL
ncbi:hypothetical protein Bbelb_430600 [Branchiostoma belcheri]|nr:hypothetical protein Bbelb_430600 [Branchiostoma belcheri]